MSSGVFFNILFCAQDKNCNKLFCIQVNNRSICCFEKKYGIKKSTTGRMTLFSASGILSVKTGGIRDGKGRSNDEELGALCI